MGDLYPDGTGPRVVLGGEHRTEPGHGVVRPACMQVELRRFEQQDRAQLLLSGRAGLAGGADRLQGEGGLPVAATARTLACPPSLT